MRIGLISDTHGRLREDVQNHLEGVDCILHAGDFDRWEILTQLEQIAPVYGVRGNNDWGEWARDLPRCMRFSLGGVSFCMAHQRESIPWKLDGVDVVICGHTHQYQQEKSLGRLWLNPGSCSFPRPYRLTAPTKMMLDIEEGGKLTVFPIVLPK